MRIVTERTKHNKYKKKALLLKSMALSSETKTHCAPQLWKSSVNTAY